MALSKLDKFLKYGPAARVPFKPDGETAGGLLAKMLEHLPHLAAEHKRQVAAINRDKRLSDTGKAEKLLNLAQQTADAMHEAHDRLGHASKQRVVELERRLNKLATPDLEPAAAVRFELRLQWIVDRLEDKSRGERQDALQAAIDSDDVEFLQAIFQAPQTVQHELYPPGMYKAARDAYFAKHDAEGAEELPALEDARAQVESAVSQLHEAIFADAPEPSMRQRLAANASPEVRDAMLNQPAPTGDPVTVEG